MDWAGVLAAGIFFLVVVLALVRWQLWKTGRLLRERLAETERERARDEAMLGSLGEGLVVIDTHGDIVRMNPMSESLLGWKQAEVMGKKWDDVAVLETEEGKRIAAEQRATIRVLSSGKTITNDKYYYVRRDGKRFPVGTTAAPIIFAGKVIGVIAVFRDITREKYVDRAKSEFVSLASHQLRTPLSSIKWFSEMLLAGDAGQLTNEQRQFVENVAQSNERMIELVNGLLNISRIESGRIIVDPVPTDLEQLVKETVSELQKKIADKNLELVVSVAPNIPKINVDPKMVRQVYMNLLSNSIKYSPVRARIVVLISIKGSEVLSQVSDTGYGIPKREQTRVFQKFYRGENIVKLETDGTGLGLYLVKAIVESSGGRVWFESEEGKGTAFWFTLPLSGMKAKKGEVTLT
ncbi:MAG: Multi-sensor signal transduction histidine kinase, partial [Microgenomates group bacterium Gr01-1014_16]